MQRPTVTKDMILEAAKVVSERIDCSAEIIANHYRGYMDGYQLAREIERYEHIDFEMSDAEELDEMSAIVRFLHKKAEDAWAKEYNIQPELEVGTEIQQGIIAGVCQHSSARYLVKENGCDIPGSFLLVKFEDAIRHGS